MTTDQRTLHVRGGDDAATVDAALAKAAEDADARLTESRGPAGAGEIGRGAALVRICEAYLDAGAVHGGAGDGPALSLEVRGTSNVAAVRNALAAAESVEDVAALIEVCEAFTGDYEMPVEAGAGRHG